MGAPEPAILRNWRFVHYRWLSALAGSEWCDGESTQDGGSTSDSGTCARRLVQPAHCPTSRGTPGDGRTASSPVVPRQFKTGQRAHRLRGRAHRLAILPTKPYTPRHKGKIERGIGYVKGNALKGRTFTSLADQNRYLQVWETSVADT